MVTSGKKKILGMMELIDPYEEMIKMTRELKKSKYQEIVNADETKGLKVTLWSVEMGCRGFPAVSVYNYI